MAVSKSKKQAIRQELEERFEKSHGLIVSEYTGINCEELTKLRIQLRDVDSQFVVLKNRVAKRAFTEDSDKVVIKDEFKGPIALTCVQGDVAAATKVLLEYQKANDKLKVRSAVMDGTLFTMKDLKALSELPSKEVLIARMLGSLVSPHRGLMNVLKGVSTNLVRVIDAIKEQKTS